DYIVVDEVQDITNIQLKCIMHSILYQHNFMLTGDSNQIVHPNFFSWSKIKTYLYQDHTDNKPVKILQTNYRNSPQVVALSNTLLKIKNARFGSIDKESNYLIHTISKEIGEVHLLPDKDNLKADLNSKTQHSTHYAVIVSDELLKQKAKLIFKTPLIFSVHEAKGLEYENVILLNFISNNQKEFNEIIRGVETEELQKSDLSYSRAADKSDKDAEVYKFYINSLYVAITRSIRNVFIFEEALNHPVFHLLGLKENRQILKVTEEKSDISEWLSEAKRLEDQGKYEQAEQIKARIHGYEYINPQELERIKELALDPSKKESEVKKERKQLFLYACKNLKIGWIEQLAQTGFQRAILFMKGVKQDHKEYVKNCRLGREKEVERIIEKYGVDFCLGEDGVTGLMLALYYGQNSLCHYFLKQKANINMLAKSGMLPFHYLLQSFLKGEFHKDVNLAGKEF
ncbi:MAG: hypothetical protein ACRDE2_13655, partial [Chitinophagaceae bacterium]